MDGSVDHPMDGNRPGRKLRLLLAEDELSLRQLLGELLRLRYDVLTASDGQRAWEMAAGGEAFDFVLSDVEMPGLDGVELTRRLRSLARTSLVPIILLSANNQLTTMIQGLEAGADDFVLKPFRPPELLARIDSKHRLCELRRRAILQGGQSEDRHAAPVA